MSTKLLIKILIISVVILNSECKQTTNVPPLSISQRTLAQKEKNQQTIIFIHGTLFPIINFIVRTFDCPIGLSKEYQLPKTSIHGRAIRILNRADNVAFDLDSTYIFGWTGKLNFYARKKAAQDLYRILKPINTPITLIGYSHGGNVALTLAEVAKEFKDTNFKIDKLVLLATPALIATQDYVKSPIFKSIVSFYSLGDKIQILDPQGLYKETKAHCKKNSKKSPLFSQRLFPESKNLIQIRILDRNKNILHTQFILESFLKSLPATLKLIDDRFKIERSNCFRVKKCTINI